MTEEDIIPEGFKRCECGKCGELIPVINKKGQAARFKHGHNVIGKPPPPNFIRHREQNNKWKGGRIINTQGYVLIRKPDHPNCDYMGYVREHRLVMEQKLGRYLRRYEDVHHMNHNKQDNRPENLLLVLRTEHRKLYHCKDMSERICIDCKGDTMRRNWMTRGLDKGQFLCHKCYCKRRRAKYRNLYPPALWP